MLSIDLSILAAMQADVNNNNNKDTKVKKIAAIFFVMLGLMQGAIAQTYDSTTLVDTNSNSTTNSTVTSTNTNNNTNTNVNDTTVNSTNTNTNTSTNTNTNINTGHTTSENTNNNNNVNTSTNNNVNRNINSGEMTNRNINDSKIEQTVKQPPPTAMAPSMMSGGNNDLCTTGTSGAVQTQILGVSSGGTVRDMNCERLKNAKTLYDMGMKVAAVSTMCQDRRVFDAMWNAGTPCPFEGEIGELAKKLWQTFPEKIPAHEKPKSDDFYKKTGWGALLGVLLFGLL
jgi:hypothetical protein